MNLETYIERIDAYHEGALTETERLAFESDLESDAELLAAYDLYRQATKPSSGRSAKACASKCRSGHRKTNAVPLLQRPAK
jgi:anti-sigma factor RsiW